MGFLIPSALALVALAIPIIIFYMLKLRCRPVRVSSLMLWQQALQDRQANAPWQRLKRNLLLLLQLLILALLVMALARPYFTVKARVQGNVVLLLDASASMQAADVSPNRFAAAQEAALDLINRLDPDDAVTLIAVESVPRVLASTTTDRSILRHALNTAYPGNSPADWPTALTLAAANTATLPDTTIVIISDGGLALNEQSKIQNLKSKIQFIPVGQNANNQGLVALSLRDGPDGPELFLRVLNAAPEPARRLVEIQVNGRLFDARRLDIPARNSAGLSLSGLPLATQQVQATLTGDDALSIDDVAWAVRSAAPTRVLLVGEGNLFLERALALLPDIELQRATPDQPLPQSRFNLTIFDRTTPPTGTDEGGNTLPEDNTLSEGNTSPGVDTLPQGNLLFIAPPDSTSLFEVNGVITQTQLARLESRHPLLAYVELNNLHVAQAQAVKPPPWGQTLVEAEGGPLLMAGQVDGRRVAILTFDLHQSDLPLQIDFPILIINLTRWLSPGASFSQGQTLRTGQSFDLPAASSADTLLITLPSQVQTALSPDLITFNDTSDLGIYRVLAQNADRDETTFLTEFAVNLLAEEETDIEPRQLESAAGSATTAEGKILAGRQEWWWGLALLGLVILLVEWWVYWISDF